MMTAPTSIHQAAHSHLMKEIASVKELLMLRVDGVEKAIEVARAELTRVPTELDRRMSAMRELNHQITETIEEKIKQQETTIHSLERVNGDKIDDLKKRVTMIESVTTGKSQIVSPLIGLILAILSVVIATGLVLLLTHDLPRLP